MLSFILGELGVREYMATVVFLFFFTINIIFISWFFEQLQILTSSKHNVPFKYISKWLLKKKAVINYSSLFFRMTIILLFLCFVGSFICWVIYHESLSIALTGFLPFVSISGIATAVIFGNKESVISRYLRQNVRRSVYDKLKAQENNTREKVIRLVDNNRGKFILNPMLRFPLKDVDSPEELMNVFEKGSDVYLDVYLDKMIISRNGCEIEVNCTDGFKNGFEFEVQVCEEERKRWELIKESNVEDNETTIKIILIYAYNSYYFSEEGSFELIVDLETNNQCRIREIYGKG